jgi:indole-3-glycerol phosphate synthase
MNRLEEILARKRRDIAARRQEIPLGEMKRRASKAPDPPDFIAALRARPVGLIAEVKRRSPSAGTIRDPFDPAAIAQAYARGGAQAISVLLDSPFFGGGDDDFVRVKSAVKLPLLYKEFVVDSWQIAHARAIGASAVLLIVAALTPRMLERLHKEIAQAGLAALVEVHDADEMRLAIDIGAGFIGINNRNLKTFETTLETTCELAALAPRGCCLVSESGIRTADDVIRVRDAGAHAVLVGESLLRQRHLASAVRRLMERVWAAS